ncbi:MAG: hypothetical protein GY827_10940 [Cytophagales bacterium]|nr:hypothetical protein [Cytophagales bacterium]
MSKNSMLPLIITIYLFFHSPAIIASIIGLFQLKTKPQNAKKLFIFAGIYFLIGGGICGALLNA